MIQETIRSAIKALVGGLDEYNVNASGDKSSAVIVVRLAGGSSIPIAAEGVSVTAGSTTYADKTKLYRASSGFIAVDLFCTVASTLNTALGSTADTISSSLATIRNNNQLEFISLKSITEIQKIPVPGTRPVFQKTLVYEFLKYEVI